MLACSFVTLESGLTTVVYASRDGGRTWAQTKLTTDLEVGGDPICTFGYDGAAYYVVLGHPKTREQAPEGMWVYRSTDGGFTWSRPTEVPFADREYLVTDGTNGQYRGRVYINGVGGAEAITGEGASTTVAVYTSRDGGRTFTGPAERATFAGRIRGMGNSVVLSDGTVVILFGLQRDMHDPGNGSKGYLGRIELITSSDGGESLNPAVTIDDWYMGAERSQGAVMPQLAVDHSDSPFRDRLYAVWTDYRTGRLEIRLAYSADKGKTWSTSRVINDDRIAFDPAAEGPDAMTPIIAVNKQGVVGIAWYDRRDSPDNLGWYERFSASLDGGETWIPSVRVSERPNAYTGKETWPASAYVPRPASGSPDLRLSVQIGLGAFFYTGGHTGAMAVDTNGVFYPFWFDNRTGVSQIWTAPVRVAGAAAKNGSADLAVLQDVTPKLSLSVANTRYERSTNQLTFLVSLKNTSKDTVRAPLKLRVLQLKSDIGVPALVGGDNGRPGAGAILDFSPLLHHGVLLPDSASDAKRLVFWLTDLRPFRQGKEFKFGLVDLDARALGRSSTPNSSGKQPADPEQPPTNPPTPIGRSEIDRD